MYMYSGPYGRPREFNDMDENIQMGMYGSSHRLCHEWKARIADVRSKKKETRKEQKDED